MSAAASLPSPAASAVAAKPDKGFPILGTSVSSKGLRVVCTHASVCVCVHIHVSVRARFSWGFLVLPRFSVTFHFNFETGSLMEHSSARLACQCTLGIHLYPPDSSPSLSPCVVVITRCAIPRLQHYTRSTVAPGLSCGCWDLNLVLVP